MIESASTAEEKQEIYALRYEVYVDELGRHPNNADLSTRVITDYLDDTANLLFARNDGEIVATVRRNRLCDTTVQYGIAQALKLDSFLESFSPEQLSFSSKLIVAPHARNSRVTAELLRHAYLEGLVAGIEFDFQFCSASLVQLYEQLGYRRYADNFRFDDVGFQVPMVLVSRDGAHMAAVRSPLCKILKKAQCESNAAAWFVRTFPQATEFVNRRELSDDAFWERVAEMAGASLGQHGVLKGITSAHIKLLAKRATVHHFRAGGTLFSAGDNGQEMFVILKGKVDITAGSDAQLALRTLRPGDAFGEIALFSRTGRTANAVAQTDVDVLVLAKQEIARLTHALPEIMSIFLLNLLEIQSIRLHENTQSMLDMSGGQVD